jgi:hypothetical protein
MTIKYTKELLQDKLYSIITTVNGEEIKFNASVANDESELDGLVEHFVNELIAGPKDHPITYSQQRTNEYPSIVDQLDTLYHEGYEGWKAKIETIKNKYPKGK